MPWCDRGVKTTKSPFSSKNLRLSIPFTWVPSERTLFANSFLRTAKRKTLHGAHEHERMAPDTAPRTICRTSVIGILLGRRSPRPGHRALWFALRFSLRFVFIFAPTFVFTFGFISLINRSTFSSSSELRKEKHFTVRMSTSAWHLTQRRAPSVARRESHFSVLLVTARLPLRKILG